MAPRESGRRDPGDHVSRPARPGVEPAPSFRLETLRDTQPPRPGHLRTPPAWGSPSPPGLRSPSPAWTLVRPQSPPGPPAGLGPPASPTPPPPGPPARYSRWLHGSKLKAGPTRSRDAKAGPGGLRKDRDAAIPGTVAETPGSGKAWRRRCKPSSLWN
ncbi:uncharacterized protein RHO17_000713 isoform 1-T1 [Thomomys bottae]